MARPRTSGARRTFMSPRDRGVISILAMMFMVLFGSLAAAMAIVSKGNLRTAQTYLRVSGAIGAVDAGMGVAQGNLRRAGESLRVWKGEITTDYGLQLWNGTYTDADGDVLNPEGDPTNAGLRDILAALHPTLDDPGTISIEAEYTPQSEWLVTAPIVLESIDGQVSSAFQVTYIPVELPDEDRLGVRAVVTGFSWDFVSQRWTRRAAQQLFVVSKHPKQAVLGANKIMIGKNVQINGPLGARFTEVDFLNGHPVIVRSDFFGLDPVLDQKLIDFYQAVLEYDTDGDNRLRTQHTVESAGLAQLAQNHYDAPSGGQENNMIVDYTGDGYVDEFDIFLKHYDANGDGKVALSDELRAGTPHAGLTAEFAGIDDDLALLLDSAMPDRNGDGVIDSRDTALGYRDGVLDHRDRYAKIRGQVIVRAQRHAWEAQPDEFGSPIGDYQQFVAGAIRSGDDDPVVFGAGDDLLPDVGFDTFDSASSELGQAADGAPFESQAGVSWVWELETNADGVVVGQTLNPAFYSTGEDDDIGVVVEKTPLGAPAPADYYERPVFRNMVFKNVVIPKGLNALFENCTFAGVTRIQTHYDNTHASWRFYGIQESDLSLAFPPLPEESEAQLDNDYFPDDGSIIPPDDFDVPRLEVDGTPYVNTKPLSNNLRFHDCTIVGSIVADRPINYTHIRNKLQFTGATQFFDQHPEQPNNPAVNPDPGDMDAIAKSSLMLPHYSVDIGENNASPDQDVNLNGIIIAGVLDIRGNTIINGALMLTFMPSQEDPALQHYGEPVGNPADFNATLGYFSADDGDEEGLAPFEWNGDIIVGFDLDGDGYADTTVWEEDADPVLFNGFGRIVLNYNPELVMPDGLIAPLQIEPMKRSYHEGRVIVEASQ